LPQAASLRRAAISQGLIVVAQLDALLLRNRWLALAIASIVLVTFWASGITAAAVEKDASETLRMAINLQHHGVASMDEQAPFRPAMTREPVPVAVNAALIGIADAIAGPADPQAYFSGERARLLKLQNVFWLGLLSAVVFGSVFFFTGSPTAASIGMLLVNLPLFDETNARYLADSLYTEAPAAALLALGSILLAAGVARNNWKYIAGAGLALALLALVKAVFLYVSIGVLLVLVLARLIAWRRGAAAPRSTHLIVFAAFFAVLVLPWMYRNYAALGQFEISARGGEVLYHRAVEDRLTAEEIRGALSYWAPWPVNGVLRRVFGFSEKDFERGGRLQRLNRSANSSFAAADLEAERTGRPQDAISNYRKSRAELARLIIQLQEQGHPEPVLEANRIQKSHALELIKERPLRHLAMTAAFLWRGAFLTFPVLFIGLVWAAWRRDYTFGLYLVPAFGMIMFYGLFSHFIPRYSLPAYPIALLVAVVLCTKWLTDKTAAGGPIARRSSEAFINPGPKTS
jgi:hypothetical protein